jgi:hypothetical protein
MLWKLADMDNDHVVGLGTVDHGARMREETEKA